MDVQATQEPTHQETEVVGGWASLLRFRALVAAVTLVLTLGVLAWSLLQAPVYSATVQVLVGPSGDSASVGGVVVSSDEVATQRLVATSERVLMAAANALGGGVTPSALKDSVTVEPVANTRVLAFTVKTASAQESADWANALADAFASDRNGQTEKRSKRIRTELSALTASLTQRLATVNQQLGQLGNADNTALLTDQRSLQAQLGQVSARLQNLVAATGSLATPAQVLSTAGVPGSPTSPRPVLYTALGLVLGLLLGVAAALLAGRIWPVHLTATPRRQTTIAGPRPARGSRGTLTARAVK